MRPGIRKGATGARGGVYLFAVLFLPAALAPSACKRNPKHPHQQGADTDSTHGPQTETGAGPGPLLHSPRMEKSVPSGRKESGHSQPHPHQLAWPFESS